MFAKIVDAFCFRMCSQHIPQLELMADDAITQGSIGGQVWGGIGGLVSLVYIWVQYTNLEQ